MGTIGAMGMADAVNDGLASLDQALSWHLTSNHYPPLPTSLIPVCKKAIELAANEEGDEMVDLPDGITWRGLTEAPAWEIVDAHHLDAFVSAEIERQQGFDEDDEDDDEG